MIGELSAGKTHEPVDDADTQWLVAEKVEDSKPQRIGKRVIDPALFFEFRCRGNAPCKRFKSPELVEFLLNLLGDLHLLFPGTFLVFCPAAGLSNTLHFKLI